MGIVLEFLIFHGFPEVNNQLLILRHMNGNANKEVSNQESRSWNPGHILVTVSLSHAGSKGLFS